MLGIPMYTLSQNKRGRCFRAAPAFIYESMTYHRHIIHHFKGNPLEVPIYLKVLKNILISRIYEQFSRNDSAMAPEWLSEKNSNFQNMNILYIALKHIIW